jgi:hypothetical protein
VHIVEATKQVYRVVPARRERRRFVQVLKPALIPSPGAVGASLAPSPPHHVRQA